MDLNQFSLKNILTKWFDSFKQNILKYHYEDEYVIVSCCSDNVDVSIDKETLKFVFESENFVSITFKNLDILQNPVTGKPLHNLDFKSKELHFSANDKILTMDVPFYLDDHLTEIFKNIDDIDVEHLSQDCFFYLSHVLKKPVKDLQRHFKFCLREITDFMSKLEKD